MSGLCVHKMKSGLLFLYTSLALVCNHCHDPVFATRRYAIKPDAPVFKTAEKTRTSMYFKMCKIRTNFKNVISHLI